MRMKKETNSKTNTQRDICVCLLIRYPFYTLETMQFWVLLDWRNNLGAMKRRYDSQVIMIQKCYLNWQQLKSLKYIHHLTIINECQVRPQFGLTIWQPETHFCLVRSYLSYQPYLFLIRLFPFLCSPFSWRPVLLSF